VCEGVDPRSGKQGIARTPCVVRDAPSALLTMRHIIDGIEKGLILGKPQRGCLEGRTGPIQPLVNSFTPSREEVGQFRICNAKSLGGASAPAVGLVPGLHGVTV
ncbi:MAG: hypothetical protein ACREH9_12855, partial [Pseudomonadota bacterium]